MSDLVSEDHILARIASHFPNEGPDVLLGRGDDCAVLGVSGPLCVSTDLFMEDVHFRRSYFTPEDIGWKALAVNLSDLAADGARPMGFTVGLSLPPDADMALVDGLCAGMAELAAQASVPLVGGDLSRADKLHLCLTVFGQAEKTLLRGEAQPGDVIFLIGRTGLARAGLLLLEERGRAALNGWPIPCEAHLRPAPRLKEGMRLSRLAADWGREKGDPTCGRLGLMDLSDGLARDLPRLIGPGAWARTSACPCRTLKSCASCVPATRPNPSPQPGGTPSSAARTTRSSGRVRPNLPYTSWSPTPRPPCSAKSPKAA